MRQLLPGGDWDGRAAPPPARVPGKKSSPSVREPLPRRFLTRTLSESHLDAKGARPSWEATQTVRELSPRTRGLTRARGLFTRCGMSSARPEEGPSTVQQAWNGLQGRGLLAHSSAAKILGRAPRSTGSVEQGLRRAPSP
jgi:hypothetical protein